MGLWEEGFVVERGEVTEGAVEAFAVVEAEIVVQIVQMGASVGASGEGTAVDAFEFEDASTDSMAALS